MKATVSFCLGLIAGGLCWTSNAYSLIVPFSVAPHSPAICRSYNAAQILDIDYLPSAVRNINASPRYIICPLVVDVPSRFVGTTADYLIDVAIEAATLPNQSITCTLVGYTNTGTYIYSSSFTMSDVWGISGQAIVGNSGVSVSMLCLMPGNAGGRIDQLSARVRAP